MNSLLNPESKLMLIFTKIAYSAYLNILWFLCCLPIVDRVLESGQQREDVHQHDGIGGHCHQKDSGPHGLSLKAALASAGERLAILLKDDNLNTLHGRKKIGHILAYYKFPLFILCIFLYFIGRRRKPPGS